MTLYRRLLETASEEGCKAIFRWILSIAKDKFYVLGTVMQTGSYGVVKK